MSRNKLRSKDLAQQIFPSMPPVLESAGGADLLHIRALKVLQMPIDLQ